MSQPAASGPRRRATFESLPNMRQRYRRKPDQAVTAVQLALDFDGLHYRKWGHNQQARPGDWLVDSDGEVYTVAADSFAKTYRQVGPGRWVKSTPLWAERATQAGSVATKEGHTSYQPGDWLVSNNADGSDAYAISAAKFEKLYEPEPGTAPGAKGASEVLDPGQPGTALIASESAARDVQQGDERQPDRPHDPE